MQIFYGDMVSLKTFTLLLNTLKAKHQTGVKVKHCTRCSATLKNLVPFTKVLQAPITAKRNYHQFMWKSF